LYNKSLQKTAFLAAVILWGLYKTPAVYSLLFPCFPLRAFYFTFPTVSLFFTFSEKTKEKFGERETTKPSPAPRHSKLSATADFAASLDTVRHLPYFVASLPPRLSPSEASRRLSGTFRFHFLLILTSAFLFLADFVSYCTCTASHRFRFLQFLNC
jgi:hypothetical protein